MKKKQLELTNQIYGIAPKRAEIRIKQTASRSQNKSTSKQKSVNISHIVAQQQQAKTTRYRAYLQNQIISKLRPNRRYAKKQDEGTFYRSKGIMSRNERNQSVDVIKIRKSKVSSSQKVKANSFTRLDENIGDFQNAKQLYKQGKFSQAAQIAQQCLIRDNNNKQYLYYTAIIYLNLQNYSKGLQLLKKVCKNNPEYKKTSFLFAAIAAKHLNDLQRAKIFCTTGLQNYPDYANLLQYRASIFMITQQYQNAHEDYQKIEEIDSKNIQNLLKNADCLLKMGAYSNCLQKLANAMYLDKGQYRRQILTKRIQIFLSPQNYNIKQAKKDLSKLLMFDTQGAQVNYLKGLIFQAEGFKKQSILAFEQSLKQGGDKETMVKALIQIVKNKINDRDFYSALYHINRSKYFQMSGDEIQMYRLFSEGVVHLMKRKVAEGDKNFTILIQKYRNLTPDLKKIFYLYRAFAKFSLSQYKICIQNYQMASQQNPLDIFAKFNKQLAQGIVQISAKNYEKGLQFFDLSEKTISLAKLNKTDPFLYRAAAYIQQAKDQIKNSNNEELKSLQQIFTGLKQLDKAYDINDSNSNLLYFRALVYLYLGKYDQSLQDIIKAIAKSQQNVAKYFFFRGITQSSLGNMKQALNDFNICSNLDDKFEMVYLQRAKIHFANENTTKGLQDLAKLKNINPNQDVKFHEACLNYFNGHYIMANACCEQISNPQKCRQIKILIKTKLSKIKQARKLARAKGDEMIFDILLGRSQFESVPPEPNMQFFTQYHYHFYLGIKYFCQGDYNKSLSQFTMSAKQRNLYDLEQGIASNNLIQQNQQGQNQQQDQQSNDRNALHRINYNIFLCYLQLKQFKKGHQTFIRDVVGVKQQFLKNQFIATFSHLLFQSLKQSKNEINQEQKQMYQLNLYQIKLDKALPEFSISLPNLIMKTRLCTLSMTNPKLQKLYKTKVNPDFILQYMKMSQIQNRPEPPWVKREETGLIFTDEIQNINIDFKTTENDEEDEEEGEQEDGEDEGEDEEGEDDYQKKESQQNLNANISKSKFKQKMKLNDSIERKLQKIMEAKKKNS